MNGGRALARVNVAAVGPNVARLVRRLGVGVEMCAVVKADADGHGAVRVARTALECGATRPAVSTALEAKQLRAAGIEASLLVIGLLSPAEHRDGKYRSPRARRSMR
jgi:alanine racemase